MQAVLVEGLMGLVGSMVLGLVGLQTLFGMKYKPALVLKPKPRPRAESVSLLSTSTLHCPSLSAKPDIPGPSVSGKNLQACPSCGLQAPEELMGEHFQGSPTHKNGRTRGAVDEDEPQFGVPARHEDPATLALLRSLMRVVVPPRAFGLRGEERKIHPLRGLVRRSSPFETGSISLSSYA